MPNLRDLATNLFNQGGQRIQQTVNPILQSIQNFQAQNRNAYSSKANQLNARYQVPLKIADPVLGLGQGFIQGQTGFTGLDKKIPLNPNYQPQTPIGKGAQFVGQLAGFATGPGKFLNPLESKVAGTVSKFVPKPIAATAPLVNRAANTLVRRGLPTLAAEAASSLPLAAIQSRVENEPFLNSYATNVGMGLAGRGAGEIVNQGGKFALKGVKAGKQAIKETEKQTFENFLNTALKQEQGLVKTLGQQKRNVIGQYGAKAKLTRAIGSGDVMDKNIPMLRVVLSDNRELIVPPSRLLREPNLIQFVQGPANDAATKAYRQAYSGGFIKPDEFFGVKTQSFESPYSKGDIGKLENQLDELIGTQSYVNSGKWQAKSAARQTALAALQDSADRGDVEAQKYLTVVQMLQRSIEEAKTAKNIKPSDVIPSTKTTPTEPTIDRTKLSGRQLDMTNAQLKEANQFQSDMEAQALNTQKTNTTSGTQTGKRPQVSQLFRAPEDLPSSQTSSPARENLDRLLQTRQEVFSRTGKSSQKSLVSSLPPEHYTELQQSFKDRTPDQKVNIIDYLRTPEKVLQKIGLGKEAELLKKQYNTYLDELPKEIGKITDWSKRVSPEANVRIFRYLDGQKDIPLAPEELKVATEIKTYLKEWADKLGLPQDSRIASYITHIFEKDIIQKEFDPEIARMIQDRVPGSVYDPFLQKRLGELGYVEDTWRALDAYVKRATRKYNMDQALEPLQAAAEKLDVDSYKYVERLGARINLRPTELDNLMDNTIKSVVGYRFGQRPVAAISRNIRQAVYRGTLGLNVGSAVRNLTQGVNTYSELGERYTIKGYLSLARDIASGSDELTRVGVLRDDFIQDRALSATKQSLQKLDKGLFALFEAAERINRGAAYYGAKSRALAQGKTEQQAIQEAIKLVEKTQFRFGSVDTPVAMQSDMAKLILQFQSYALKQGEFLAGKVANKEYAGLIRYALGSFVVAKTVGSLIGMDITDMIPGYGLATGEQKIGQTPAFQFGSSVVSAATDQPDKYGNKRTFKEKAINIGESAVPLIPAGVQIKKTIQGLDAVRKGYSESASGRVQYVVPQDAPTAVKAGLLGKSKLPQAQEYFKNKESVLSEKQSGIVKAASDKATEYKNIITTRKANREEDKVREEIKASGVGKQVGQQYVFLDTNGKTKSIDLNFNPTMPKLTGQAALDKKIIADYRGDITKKANDIQSLYEQGQLSAQQAEAQLKVLEQKALKVKKPKKPKKITVKTPKLKAIKLLKFKPIKVKKLKKIKFKKYKPKTIRV